MAVLERDIELFVVRWARDHGFLTPKVKFVEAGWPDRMFISPRGHTIFIEFKRPGNTPDPLQVHRLKELQERGIPAFWCDTAPGAISILQQALAAETLPEPRDQTSVGAGVRRAVPRSGAGENVISFSRFQNSEEQRTGEQDARGSAAAPGVQGMAGRDKEME